MHDTDQFHDDIPVETLREKFSYDPLTGIIIWRVKHARPILSGWEAGCLAPSGYRLIRYCGKMYTSHRIAWAMTYGKWPTYEIDHINRIKNDNRIENLREATSKQQTANHSMKRHNTSGFRGVYLMGKDKRKKAPRKKPWIARITIDGRVIGLGLYATPKEASEAYNKAAEQMLGGFYRPPN